MRKQLGELMMFIMLTDTITLSIIAKMFQAEKMSSFFTLSRMSMLTLETSVLIIMITMNTT